MDTDPLPASELDRLVDASTDIDPFCSTSDWVLPAYATWGEGAVSFVSSGVAALALTQFRSREGARIMAGMDPLWGFACPAVGAEASDVADLTLSSLVGSRRHWHAVLLSGLQDGSPRSNALQGALGARFSLRQGPTMTRRIAALEGDWDAYLARRSSHFRRNLRQAQRRADKVGLHFETVIGGGPAVVARAASVERLSWKGQQGSGLSEAQFASFYERLAQRIAPASRLRAVFARHEGTDVGYILGAIRNRRYRGFQLSYHDGLAGLSIGNLLQAHQLRLLATEGIARYDLGMDMAYKLSWSDETMATYTLIVLPA